MSHFPLTVSLRSLETDPRYEQCIIELATSLLDNNPGNIEAIVLYGGLVRDAMIYSSWSDIDILVVFRDISKRCLISLASLTYELQSRYHICIDLSQISLEEITDPRLLSRFYNSEIINALALRNNVSYVIYGEVPRVSIPPEQERQAAVFYIFNTLNLFRRYLIEVIYNPQSPIESALQFQRIVRWTFSIVRASLRLFGIFSHPYQDSIPHVKRMFPELDVTLLLDLLSHRANIGAADINDNIYLQVEDFLNNYVKLALRRYWDEELQI